jgi:hypothetical protein
MAVFVPFSYIPGGFEVLFDFFDSLHHPPWARHSPNSRRTKQYIYIYIYIIYYTIYYIIPIIYINIGASDYGCGMT